MPVMETKAGTADWLPGIFQTVGGFGHTKVSYSLECKLLLLLKQKLPSISAVCSARQTMLRDTGQATCSSVPREQSKQIAGAPVLSGKGGSHSPLPGQTCPTGPGRAERPAGQLFGLTPTPLSRSHVLLRAAPLPVNASLLLQPTRPAGMRSLAPPPRDALYTLAPSPPPASLLQSDTRWMGTNGVVPQMPPWHRCLGSSCSLA